MDRQAKEEFDQLVHKYGEDNLRGYVELMTCHYEKSIVLFKEREVSNNSKHSCAGQWLLASADQDRMILEALKEMYPMIIEKDPKNR